MINKAIVTNTTVLKKKYGARYALVERAIAELIEADRQRGLISQLVAIDSPADMKAVGGRAVSKLKPSLAKQAIDAIYASLQPQYILILGGPDAVPFQPLKNPCYSRGGDEDVIVPSDLPYACSAGYSTNPARFMGPTRIVGRLPDPPGEDDPTFLIKLLAIAAHWTGKPQDEYRRYFGISAKVWQKSTSQSLSRVFGSSHDMMTVPPDGPGWPDPYMGRRIHFINCHGASTDTQFYGQQGGDFPVAQMANQLAAKVSEGTVVAAECCYGGQVFPPGETAGQSGICLTYLGGGAYAFLGSSTIAYGPSAGSGQADLICQHFVESVLKGASTGRALLEARHHFAGEFTHLDPTDLKTLAQFYLLGDPSIHPVIAEQHALASTKAYQAVFNKGDSGVRALRRERLVRTGTNLHETLGTVVEHHLAPPAHVIKTLEDAARESGLVNVTHKSFSVKFPATAGRGELRQFAERRSSRAIYMAAGQRQVVPGDQNYIVAVMATVEDGQMVHLRRVHSR